MRFPSVKQHGTKSNATHRLLPTALVTLGIAAKCICRIVFFPHFSCFTLLLDHFFIKEEHGKLNVFEIK